MESDRIRNVARRVLFLEMTAESNNLRDFLQCVGLIKVAWEKLKVCLRSNM